MNRDVNLFEFSDYRKYLRAWLEYAKERKKSNLTRLAEAVGVHPTYLSHVLNGTKDLSAEQAFLVSEHFSLTKLEREYFFILIQIERAGSVSLKQYLLEKKNDLLKQKDQLKQRFGIHRELTDTERAIYYSSWIYSALAVATDIQKGQSALELSEKFDFDRNQIQQILDFLTSIGVVKEKNGRYSLGENHIHVPNESPFVVKHHLNWRIKAIQNMDNRQPDELFLTAPMSISESDYANIREKINLAIKDIIKIAKESRAEKVICMNIDFFRVTD